MTINKRRTKNIPIIPSSEMDRTSVYFIPELKHKLKVIASQLSLECNQTILYSKIVNEIIMEHIDTFIEDYKKKARRGYKTKYRGVKWTM